MTEHNEEAISPEAMFTVGSVRNPGEPLRFANVEPLAGVCMQTAREGQTVELSTRLALTSDEPLFHRIIESFDGTVNYMAQQSGTAVNLRRANTVLLILKPDNTAELWIDTAAVSLRCIVKRVVQIGTAIFDHDIADVTAMTFPCITFGKQDKVLCFFREAWRFGFAFDMNPKDELDIEAFFTTLGTLHRELRYRHLYEAINNPKLFDKLLITGWFPFVEIITSEFKELLPHYEAGFDVTEIEDNIVAKFDDLRLQHMFERWIAKPHFAAKANLLREAIDGFVLKKPASVIKIILTEIEGVLNDAYKAVHGHGAKLKELLNFAKRSAAERVGGSNTLLFSDAFGQYLAMYTFANFDPVKQTGSASSRHAVGHGAAAQETYTMVKALQAILTLDQLAFYT